MELRAPDSWRKRGRRDEADQQAQDGDDDQDLQQRETFAASADG